MKNKKHKMVCVCRFLALLEMTTQLKERKKRFAAAKPPQNALSHQAKRHVERSETSFSNSLQVENENHTKRRIPLRVNPVRDLSSVENAKPYDAPHPVGMQRLCYHAVASLTGCRFHPCNIFSTELSSPWAGQAYGMPRLIQLSIKN